MTDEPEPEERATTVSEDSRRKLGNVIRIDEGQIRGHLDQLVRSTVEETLNGLLDAEADRRAAPNATSAARRGGTTARATTSTVSDLNQKIYKHIEAWRSRPIEGEHPYI